MKRRTVSLLAAALALGAAPCAMAQTAPAANAPSDAAPATTAPATTAPATPAPSSSAPAAAAPAAWTPDPNSWYTFNGDLKAQKFSPATQITPDNVKNLKKVWEVHTGDVSDGSGKVPASDWSATPLFVNDTVYVGTPFYRIFALDPGTGKVKWTFDTHAKLEAPTQPEMKNRGVAYWQSPSPQAGQPCQKIVYIGTMEAKLFAVDADTGKACESFGDKGVLDVNQWNKTNDIWPLSLLQPPTVYKDTLILGWAGRDWVEKVTPPGSVFGIDARTGKLKWQFNALPPGADANTGTSNVWASMSVDPDAGMVYMPVSSPSPDFYGGDRTEDLPYSTSVTALNAETGEVVWKRQLVHHDIWDYDTNSAPALVDIKKDGQTIPALVQSSKQGFLYVLNRKTGEPIYPIEEKPVPASDVDGEKASPTQPFVDTPEATVPAKFPGVWPLADWSSFGYCSRTLANLRYDGKFTPPSVKGSLAWPATSGGVEWGGGAVDEANGTYIVNSSEVAQIYRLIPRAEYDKLKAEGKLTSADYEQKGAPYAFHLETFLTPLGLPCWKPPYGTMSAYNLATGKLLWRKPFGEVQKWGFYMPKSWGSATIGAPLITASGLVFIGASMDGRVRAVDEKTGDVLWSAVADAPAVAMPATYTYKGRQYVVFVAGGNSILIPRVSDQVVAYALPQ